MREIVSLGPRGREIFMCPRSDMLLSFSPFSFFSWTHLHLLSIFRASQVRVLTPRSGRYTLKMEVKSAPKKFLGITKHWLKSGIFSNLRRVNVETRRKSGRNMIRFLTISHSKKSEALQFFFSPRIFSRSPVVPMHKNYGGGTICILKQGGWISSAASLHWTNLVNCWIR